jgi:glucose/arabinose dehydrogenase
MMSFKIYPLFVLLSFSTLLSGQLPSEFSDQLVSDKLDYPMGLVADENGQMYIWEKQGQIFVLDTNGVHNPQPLLDLREEIANWGDHGLNSVALDPDFLENGYLYLLYVVERNYWLNFGKPNYHPDSTIEKQATFARVARYTADISTNFSTLIPDSKLLLMGEEKSDGIPILNQFHGTGTILASVDGTLLISVGDATRNFTNDGLGGDIDSYTFQAIEDGIITADQAVDQYKSQYLNSLNGKVFRIHSKTGNGLSSNPFFDVENPRSARSRIWNLGLRNPYRMAMRPESGSHFSEEGKPGVLFIGDVGDGSWEELNISKNGGENFGWPIIEGLNVNWSFQNRPTPDNPILVNPLFELGQCDKEYFNFRELFFRALPQGQSPVFSNPCNTSQTLPDEAFPMVETLPEIIWSHAKWNLPMRAELPYFNEEDKIRGREIEDPESGVLGENFGGFSSLAGTFYSGNNFPQEYHDAFFAFDFSGWIRKFQFDENHELVAVEPFYDNVEKVIHLTENPADGCLYFINLLGDIRKICFGGNPRPIAVAKVDKQYGTSPLTVQFDASESYDPFGDPLTFHWNFGDGKISTETNPTHTFESQSTDPQSFKVILTATDTAGAFSENELIISLNNTPPNVEVTSFQDGDFYPMNETSTLNLEAKVSDAEHDIEDLAFGWQVFLHHSDHYHPSPTNTAQKTFALISPLGCEEEPYWYRIELEVTDPEGLSTRISHEIFPNCDDDFIEFGQMNGEVLEGEIDLYFETLLEDTVAILEIQRSSDYLNFETIGMISPEGISSNLHQYSVKDNAPLLGANIYRIKAISTNRAFEYSGVLPLTFPKKPDLFLYPNPTDGVLQVEVKNPQSESIQLEFFSPNGQKILEFGWQAQMGKQFKETVLVNQLPTGIYFYRILNEEEAGVGKLMVK